MSPGSLWGPLLNLRYGPFAQQWQQVVLTPRRAALRAYNGRSAHLHDARPDNRQREDPAFTFIALRDHSR